MERGERGGRHSRQTAVKTWGFREGERRRNGDGDAGRVFNGWRRSVKRAWGCVEALAGTSAQGADIASWRGKREEEED